MSQISSSVSRSEEDNSLLSSQSGDSESLENKSDFSSDKNLQTNQPKSNIDKRKSSAFFNPRNLMGMEKVVLSRDSQNIEKH